MNVATTTAGLTDLKFRLAREDFADAVAWVARNLPSRPTVPVLAGVLLTGTDEGLTISGFDYEVSAEVQIPAEIASPGSVLVSGRLLSDIVRALPAKPVDVSVEGTRVALSCGSARFSLPTMAVEDYPTLPALPDDEFYHTDLISLTVYDTGGVELGRVKAVLNHGAADLLELQLPGGSKTVLLPFTRAVVPTVDLASGRIVADPPEGLLE